MTPRILVTGTGAVSALGSSAQSNWEAVIAGRSGIGPRVFDPGPHGPPPVTLPAAIPEDGFESALEARCGRKLSATLDRFSLMALAAAFEALDAAGLMGSPTLETRTAVVLGHGQGGQQSMDKGYERFYGLKTQRMHPASVPKIMVSGAVSAVAMQFGIHGPVFATSSACASSAHAVIQGASLIQSGLADVAIVGGSEAIATPGSMAGWMAIQALASDTCRPFSAGRSGMVMAEGAAALILESWEHAQARGAVAGGEYLGGGMSSDAFHITQPSLDGASAALGAAVRIARTHDGGPVLVSAHGTGTALNDANEAAAIRRVFGDEWREQAVIATKSAHGHLIGGSSALQAVLAIRAINEGLAPPVLNYLGPDPDCEVELVLQTAREIRARTTVVNAFAFGGLNATMAFGRAP